MTDDLIERLRNGREGWSCDALCVEAETAAEAATRIATQQEAIDELVDELNALSDWASLMQSGERSDWGAGADKAYADMEERLNAIIDKHGERT